jgi:hypothetical protein
MKRNFSGWIGIILLFLVIPVTFAQAEGRDSALQEINGNLNSSYRADFYDLANLQAGDRLTITASSRFAFSAPLLILHDTTLDYLVYRDLLMTSGGSIPDDMFLVWHSDFDSRETTVEYVIPQDGDFRLMVGNCCDEAIGEYQLVIGLNADTSATDQLENLDSVIATSSHDIPTGYGIQELTAPLLNDGFSATQAFHHLSAGDTLYFYAETLEGNLIPEVQIEHPDLNRKAYPGEAGKSTIQGSYPVLLESEHYKFKLKQCQHDSCPPLESDAEFRLLIGLNAPEVLDGNATPTLTEGQFALVKQPMQIYVGLNITQISNVNQKEKNFEVVAILSAFWHDPAAELDIEMPGDSVELGDEQIVNFLEQNDQFLWPQFTIYNQQSAKDVHYRFLDVGRHASKHGYTFFYEERFNVRLQATEFDFVQFPLDSQNFTMQIESIHWSNDVVFGGTMPSGLGTQLGEEEWELQLDKTEITNRQRFSQFNMVLSATRNSSFYIFRMFVPLAFILLLGWSMFFIKDYDMRISASSGNVLLFIAFNFTIGDDLPRLGYLTFMDTLLFSGFLLTVTLFLVDVFLKRLHSTHPNLARRMDIYLAFIYACIFVIGTLVILTQFNLI